MSEDKNILCPNCEGDHIVYDPKSGENVCGHCGLVIVDEVVTRSPEWRAYTLEERARKSRTGMPVSYTQYDKGLYTSFRTDRDSSGRRLKSKERRKMWRLRKQDIRSKMQESGIRNLSRAMTLLDRMASTLHLPQNIREKAAITYRKALKKDLIRGRTIEGFVAASLYAACRRAKIPRSLKEVSKASTMNLKDVARTYRLLVNELGISMPVDYPMKFVPKIASQIKASRETDRLTMEILKVAKEKKALMGKDPRGMAAAALYMASKANGERATQREIANSAGTTEVTLRNRLRDLEDIIDENKLNGFNVM
jgi:transcription initiation factor TFIIB